MINQTCLQVMQRRLTEHSNDKYLFQSEAVNIERGKKQPISRRSVGRVFEKVGAKDCTKTAARYAFDAQDPGLCNV